jgi:hypothetical protein
MKQGFGNRRSAKENKLVVEIDGSKRKATSGTPPLKPLKQQRTLFYGYIIPGPLPPVQSFVSSLP